MFLNFFTGKAMVKTDIRALESFCQSIAYEAARNLDLLKAIDGTISELEYLGGIFSLMHHHSEKFLSSASDIEGMIDEDGSLVASLDKARDAIGSLLELYILKRKSAVADARLNDDDGVVDAYERIISITSDLFDSVDSLISAVAEHDADLDEVLPGEFFSAADLIKALRG